MEGLFEVVVLKSQFSDQNETYLINFLILELTLTSGKLFYRAIKLETTDTEFHLFGLRLGFKYGRIAAVSKHIYSCIYRNFMEYGIPGIGIWLNL